MKLIRKLHYIYKKGGIDAADIRNFKIISFAVLFNFSFFAEKFFIVIKHPLTDFVWMCVYGGLTLYTGYIAIVDFIHDEIEEEGHNSPVSML